MRDSILADQLLYDLEIERATWRNRSKKWSLFKEAQ